MHFLFTYAESSGKERTLRALLPYKLCTKVSDSIVEPHRFGVPLREWIAALNGELLRQQELCRKAFTV